MLNGLPHVACPSCAPLLESALEIGIGGSALRRLKGLSAPGRSQKPSGSLLQIRTAAMAATRDFLTKDGFAEFETPLLHEMAGGGAS